MVIWDFQLGDTNAIREWAADIRLGKRDRGLLDQKLDALTRLRFDLATHTHLVAGPLRTSADKHIYKLHVNASIMIRILLCRGPIGEEDGVTLLAGATERDGNLVPSSVVETASERRGLVVSKAEKYRRRHERFSGGA